MKTVLIITYYWPPAGGPGVQRWLKFVKYFKEFDVNPIVYVPENPNYPLKDERFLKEVSPGIQILKHAIKEPYRFANLLSQKKTKNISSGIISKKNASLLEKGMLYIRGNFFIPDARIGWVKPSVKFLSEFISHNSVDILISTGPPHSLHLIGKRLKEAFNIPWIADFRDPWTTIHYHKSLRLTERSKEKHKKLEKEVLDGADVIVVTSPTTKKEFQKITRTDIQVVTNGYDISSAHISVELDTEFSIAHIGSLLSERNPEILWKVLAALIQENEEIKNDLKLIFAGAVSDEVKKQLVELKLDSNVQFLGYIPHSKALSLQRSSQVLLLLEMDRPETKAIIPGKLFEYLAAKRPIVAIGPEGSDMEKIIEETESGTFFNSSQKDELKALITSLYKAYKQGELRIHSRNIEKFSRRNLTQQMADLIHKL